MKGEHYLVLQQHEVKVSLAGYPSIKHPADVLYDGYSLDNAKRHLEKVTPGYVNQLVVVQATATAEVRSNTKWRL